MTRRILILAPNCDGTDVGEAWAAHQWVDAIGRARPVTLLTLRRPDRLSPSRQLAHVEVIEWPDIAWPDGAERMNSMLKPGYVRYYARARRWIWESLKQGRRFAVVHQLNPFALRYPSPAAGFGIPLVIGPLAGSLETPAGFEKECGTASWFVRLRGLDRVRLRRDPLLRHTFASAEVVIGVAPYVRDILSSIPIKRFEVCSETGIHELAGPGPRSYRGAGELRLLHVGRAVRTKGLRDCVRALAQLNDLSGVTLTSAGEGEEIAICRREAHELGIADRVGFLGRVPRERVEDLYANADVFLFPSFREPSGSVVFESMRHGLPIITTDRGGPGYVVDDSVGIRIPPIEPVQFARDLAEAVRRLAFSPADIGRFREGSRRRIAEIGLWSVRVQWMLDQYQKAIESRSHFEAEFAK